MQRIRFFDIAKGIAILAVILGHSAIETNLFAPHRTAQVVLSICFSFHMPLFFILSGYFMHPDRRFRWMKEAKQLLLTYVVTALCVLVGVTCMATLDHESRAIALRQWGMAAIYGSGDISNLTLWRVDLRIGRSGSCSHYSGLDCCCIVSQDFLTPRFGWCCALLLAIFPRTMCCCPGVSSRECARQHSCIWDILPRNMMYLAL